VFVTGLVYAAFGVAMMHASIARIRDPVGWRGSGWWGRHAWLTWLFDAVPRRHRGEPRFERIAGRMLIVMAAGFILVGLLGFVAALLPS
jgi:hypothetical protein